MAEDLAAALAAMSGRSPKRAGGLFNWMLANYHALVSAKADGRRTDWVAMASALDSLGLRTKRGEPLKAESIRKTWQRLSIAVKEGKVIPPRSLPPSPTDQPPVQAIPHESVLTADDFVLTDVLGNRVM